MQNICLLCPPLFCVVLQLVLNNQMLQIKVVSMQSYLLTAPVQPACTISWGTLLVAEFQHLHSPDVVTALRTPVIAASLALDSAAMRASNFKAMFSPWISASILLAV